MKAAPIAKTVRKGSLRLDIRQYADGRYGFDFTPPGEMRVKVRRESVEGAEERANEILGAAHGGKVERLAIDEGEYAEFLRWKAERGNGALIPALAKSFLATKTGKGKSVHHVRQLKNDLTAFAETFTGRIDQLSREQVEKWLNGRKVGARRWNNLRESIVALCRFARREGSLTAQLSGAELVERKEVKLNVQTYTPAELKKILNATPEEWLPLIVLGAFCGLRPMEICPDSRNGGDKPALRWEHVLWGKRKIDVPAEISKVRRRRFVPLCDAAMAFLAHWGAATGFIVPRVDMHKFTRKIAIASGVPWRNDALRHSYASYRLALTHDMAALALEMGNSPAMIFRHYLDLKHEEEAAEWFAIRPPKVPKVPKTTTSTIRTKSVQKQRSAAVVHAH